MTGGSDRDRDGDRARNRNEEFARDREQLVDRLRDRGKIEREVTADALRAVPRHEFVPPSHRENAHADRPLPIGEGQTISAPHMVGIMADLLELDPGDRVLEIGTGCGYHAAVTAEIVGSENVYSVEYHASLAESAREQLAEIGYGDVSIRVGDGHDGWPEHAPYDAAYLTCAAPEVPEQVLDQMRDDGGRLLAPIGDRLQTLVLFRTQDGAVEREEHGGVRFVPMQGGE